MKKILLVTLCVLLLLLAGCANTNCEEDKLQSYSIDDMALCVGQTAQLPLVGSSGSSAVQLSQDGIVSVENGTIRALKTGTVQVTARVECLETVFEVVVYDELLEISLDNDSSKGSVTVRSEGDLLPGTEVTLKFSPVHGYAVDTVTLNGETAVVTDNQVTFTIQEDTVVAVTYREVLINILVHNNSSATLTIDGVSYAAGQTTVQYRLGEVLDIVVSHTKTDLIPTVKIGGRTVTLNDRTRPIYTFQHTVTEDTTIYVEVAYYTYRATNADILARQETVLASAETFVSDYYYYPDGAAILDVDLSKYDGYGLESGKIYRGMPYCFGVTSPSAYDTLISSTSSEGVHIMDTSQFVGKWYFLMGGGCSSVPYWAWSTISKSISFVDATTMTPSHGCWKVGDYTATYTTNSSGRESYANTYTDCTNNGTTKMYAAYAQLQPGDGATRYSPSASTGHAILIADVVVVKNANGTINGSSSYVLYHDTHGKAGNKNTTYKMNGTSYPVWSSCTVNGKMYFSTLYSEGYLPVTCKELLTNQETLETFTVTDSKSGGLAKASVLAGTLTSNHNISHVTMVISQNGNVKQDAIRYWNQGTFSMAYFADQFHHSGWSSQTTENYKLYTEDNIIDLSKLSIGVYNCTVTVYNGNGDSYEVRNFDFVV